MRFEIYLNFFKRLKQSQILLQSTERQGNAEALCLSLLEGEKQPCSVTSGVL